MKDFDFLKVGRKFRIALVFAGITLFFLETVAQPSQTTMLAKVKNEFDVDLISHKLIGPGGIDREFREGFYVDIFTQPFEVVQKSEFPEYPVRYKASLRYMKSGNSWVFEQFTVGSSSYLNVPAPDKTEMINQLTEHPDIWMGNIINYAVGEIESIDFPTDPDWYFRKPTDVAFYVQVIFTVIASPTELEKAEHLYRIYAKRENLTTPWKITNGSEKTDAKNPISKTKYSPEEIKNMKSIGRLAEENAAAATMSSLPKVPDAPVFKSDKQLFYYLHEKLLNAPDGPTAESYIMTVVDASCYEDGSTVFFKAYHADWINNLVANIDKYKRAFCVYPGVKAEQYGQIEFLNRTFNNYVTMTGKPVDGTWKIVDFRFSPPNDAMLKQMEGNDTNCQPKPDLSVKEVVRYKVGEKVKVQFSNGARACTIDKIDPNMDNRYFVKIVGDNSGKGYWIDQSFISK
jgi:hypothetical protein